MLHILKLFTRNGRARALTKDSLAGIFDRMAYETIGKITRLQPGFGVSAGWMKVSFTDDNGKTQEKEFPCGDEAFHLKLGDSVRVTKGAFSWSVDTDLSGPLDRFK